MRLQGLFLCVFYQIIITPSFGSVKRPVKDPIENAEPIKNVPKLPDLKDLSTIDSKSRKAILEYFKSRFVRTDQPSSIGDTHPPQAEGSISVIPNKVNVRSNCNKYTDSLPLLTDTIKLKSSPTTILPIMPNTFETFTSNACSVPTVTSLPIICLEASDINMGNLAGRLNPSNSLTIFPNFNPTFNDIYLGSNHSFNSLYTLPYPLQFNQLCLPDVLTPINMMPSNYNVINDIENLTHNPPKTLHIGSSCLNILNDNSPMFIQTPYSLGIESRTPILINENLNLFMTNRVPRIPSATSCANKLWDTHPLNYLNKPTQAIQIDQISDQLLINAVPPFPYVKNIDFTDLGCHFNLVNPFYHQISAFTPMESLSNENIECNLFPLTIPKIPREIPSFIRIREPLYNIVSDIASSTCPVDLDFTDTNGNLEPSILIAENTQETVSDVYLSPAMNNPAKLSLIPRTYINTSPAYTISKIPSTSIISLNDVVSNLVRSILAFFIPYFTSAGRTKIPVTKISSNPYSISPIISMPMKTPSSINLCNPQLKIPRSPQLFYNPMTLSENTESATFLPLEPLTESFTTAPSFTVDDTSSHCDDDSPTIVSLYSNDLSPSPEIFPLSPLKVTSLPSTSFLDYSPSQPCPSSLPSPILPSYISPLDVSPSVTAKAQLMMMKPSDKKFKTIQKFLEMVFLAELINGEGYIDWDALDTVLAILFAS